MKQQSVNQPDNGPYNKAVKQAYASILKLTKQLLCQFERDELRHTLQRADRSEIKTGTVLHELINPLFYLRLSWYEDNLLGIQYGFETINTDGDYSRAIALFTRYIYKVTAKDKTGVNIEDSVKTAYCIYTCSELYTYMEDHSNNHTFILIKHKNIINKRKRQLSVV